MMNIAGNGTVFKIFPWIKRQLFMNSLTHSRVKMTSGGGNLHIYSNNNYSGLFINICVQMLLHYFLGIFFLIIF